MSLVFKSTTNSFSRPVHCGNSLRFCMRGNAPTRLYIHWGSLNYPPPPPPSSPSWRIAHLAWGVVLRGGLFLARGVGLRGRGNAYRFPNPFATWVHNQSALTRLEITHIATPFLAYFNYRWTWIWRTTVRRIFAYDGRYAWSQSDAYQVFVICIRRILHMTDQFSWSHWVRHIQVHLYLALCISLRIFLVYHQEQ